MNSLALTYHRARRGTCNRCATARPRSLDPRFGMDPRLDAPDGKIYPLPQTGGGGVLRGGGGGGGVSNPGQYGGAGRPPPPSIDPSVGDWQVCNASHYMLLMCRS